jgi:hypothetical protein
VCDKDVNEEQSRPGSVTVTVVAAMVMVDMTVLVRVAAGHEPVVESDSVPVAVLLVLSVVEEAKVEEADVVVEVPPEDVGELVVNELDCGTPHSSKL